MASPLRSGLRAGPQAPGRRLRGQDQSQAAASAQRFSKGLTRSPELHRSHGRSHAGVKGHEVDSTPPLRVSPRRGRGAWPAGSLGPGGSRGVTATPPWSPPPPPIHVTYGRFPGALRPGPLTHVTGPAILGKGSGSQTFLVWCVRVRGGLSSSMARAGWWPRGDDASQMSC